MLPASCGPCCRSRRRCSPRAAARRGRWTTGWWNRRPTAERGQVAIDAGGCTVQDAEPVGTSPRRCPRLRRLRTWASSVVLVSGAGLPTDFYPLAGMLSARRRSQRLTFVAFDVLRLNGRGLLDYDLASRREVLECLVRLSDGVLTAVHVFPGSELEDVLAGCEQLSIEGVVVKRRTSTYRPGRRTANCRKLKCPAWRADHAERRIKS